MANLVGQVLLNRFRVDAFITSTDMGAVYRVWDTERNIPLAMKVLHMADDPATLQRFQREAHTLQRLVHPNIVAFYGLYQTPDFTFLVEQFVDGPSLREILRKRGGQPLPPNEFLVYLKALCAALGYAHENGVIHCDIRPGNVLVDKANGNIYLTDFSLARQAESASTTLGKSVSPAYLAPEQLRSEPATAAADIYALGILTFELLTGRHPFAGVDAEAEAANPMAADRIRQAHLTQPPPSPLDLNPALPEALAFVIMRALSKAPEERYASASDFFDAVCDTLGSVPKRVPDRLPAQAETLLAARMLSAPILAPPGGIGPAPAAATLVSQGSPLQASGVQRPAAQMSTVKVEMPSPAAAAPAVPPQVFMPTARLVEPEEPADDLDEPRKNRIWLWLLGGVAGLAVLLCLGIFLGSMLPGFLSGLFGSPTATATVKPTLAPTVAQPTVVQPTIVLPTQSIPTSIPTPVEVATQPPTPVPPPTQAPTSTPMPVFTPAPSSLEVRVYNRFSFPINVWIDNNSFNKALLDPNKYIGFFRISLGDHVVNFCAEDGTNCGEKPIFVDTSSPNYNAGVNAIVISVP